MRELDIVHLYEGESGNETQINNFIDRSISKIKIKTEYDKIQEDLEWIEVFEEVMPHIDSILRNPNRFIINEEEIVKIELARRVTVDSIKHLAKHTNFIQAIEDNGDVKPSKILNINKDESFDTYENKLIYTLIQNMRIFAERKKAAILARANLTNKDYKSIDYNSSSRYFSDAVTMSLHIESNRIMNGKETNTEKELVARVEKISRDIQDLTSTETYRIIDKKHITLIRPPIKKTNVILKNTHFQYAMKLWNYLQDNIDDKTKHIHDKTETDSNEVVTRLFDESFLLNYLTLATLSEKNYTKSDEISNKMRDNITNQMIEQIIVMNPDMTQEQLESKITSKFAIVKNRYEARIESLQKIFKEHISDFISKVES